MRAMPRADKAPPRPSPEGAVTLAPAYALKGRADARRKRNKVELHGNILENIDLIVRV